MLGLNDVVPKNMSKKKVTDAGLALLLILLIISYFFDISPTREITLICLLVVMIIPIILKPWAYIWYAFSGVLGYVVSNLVLGIVYFLIVFPMGAIRRLMGKDSLQLKSFKKSRESVFVVRNHVFVRDDIDKTF